MKFLVDNALSPYLAQELGKTGYDAIHVRDLGMANASDQLIFERASRDNRIILTADTDFGTLLATRQASSPSVIIFRQPDKRPTTVLALCLANLPGLSEILQRGALVVFQTRRIRVRRLPLLPRKLI